MDAKDNVQETDLVYQTQNGVKFKKANLLISSKFHSPLIENKILMIAMSKIELDDTGRPIAKIKASEIMKILGKKNSSVYNQILRVSQNLSGRQILMEDRESSSFLLVNLIGSALYKDSELLIKFEPDIKNLLYDLKKNYTTLDIPMMMSFKSNYSFRIYENLKAKAYEPGKKIQNPYLTYEIPYKLSELKITIGIVDTNVESVKKALQKKNPDFDKVIQDAPVKFFNEWSDFKKNVLEVAMKEINELSDLSVSYKTTRSGRGGKVDGIIFYVKKKIEYVSEDVLKEFKPKDEQIIEDVKNNTKVPASIDVLDYIEQIEDIIDEPLKISQMKSLLKASNYNVEKIKKAYMLSKKQEHIENLMGWLISAIKNDYEDVQIPKMKDKTPEEAKMWQEFADTWKDEAF